MRQIYQALILAKWYKETIQNGLLDAVYTNKNKVAGVNLNDPTVKEQIYQRYLNAYKKGAFNYIKETPATEGQVAPRKYFSGGEVMVINLDKHGTVNDIGQNERGMMRLDVNLDKSIDSAMFARAKIKFWKNNRNLVAISTLLNNGDESIRNVAREALEEFGVNTKILDLLIKLGNAESSRNFDEYNKISEALNGLDKTWGKDIYSYDLVSEASQSGYWYNPGYPTYDARTDEDVWIPYKPAEYAWIKHSRFDQAMLQSPDKGGFNPFSTANDILSRSSKSGQKIDPKRIRFLANALVLARSLIDLQRDVPKEEINQKLRENNVNQAYFIQALNYFLNSSVERDQVRAASLIYNMYFGANNDTQKDDLRILFKAATKVIDGLNGVQSEGGDSAMLARVKIAFWAITDNVDKIAMMLGNKSEGVRKFAEIAMRKVGATKERMIDAYIAVLSSSNNEVRLWAIHKLQGLERTPRVIKAITDYQVSAMLHKTELRKIILSFSLRIRDRDLDVGWGIKSTEVDNSNELQKYLSNLSELISLDISNIDDEIISQMRSVLSILPSLVNERVTYQLSGVDPVPGNIEGDPSPDYIELQALLVRAEAIQRDKRNERNGSGRDYAQITSIKQKNLGGIDLNQINVKRDGRTVSVRFDQAQLNELMQGGFEGFTPVIISMTPIKSPLPLLGISSASISK